MRQACHTDAVCWGCVLMLTILSTLISLGHLGQGAGLDPHPPTKWLPNSSWRKAMERSSNSKEEALERALGFVHSIKTASEKSLYCRQKYIISALFPWHCSKIIEL